MPAMIQRKRPRPVRLVILGLGHQGLTALFHVVQLASQLVNEGIKLELEAFADPDLERRKRLRLWVDHHSLTPREFETFDNLLSDQDVQRLRKSLLIYDATPSHLHFDNLTNGVACHLSYFVEKPILLEYEDLPRLQAYRFWCNFVETESQAFLTTAKLLRDEGLVVKELKFWREGCTGIKKILRKERVGVTGGSLEDKILHDLAITAGLLNAKDLLNRSDEHHVAAELEMFMLNGLGELGGGKHVFMDLTGKVDGTTDVDRAADGRFVAKVTWSTDAGRIKSEYRTSWVGVSDSLVAHMRSLEFGTRSWLGEGIVKPRDLLPGYRVKEARIGHLKCVNKKGRKADIVINFLAGSRKGFSHEVSPWVEFRVGQDTFKRVSLVSAEYGDSIGGAFARVIKNFLNREEAPLLDEKMAYFVHDIMVKARRQAMRQTYDLDELASSFVKTVKDHYIPYRFGV